MYKLERKIPDVYDFVLSAHYVLLIKGKENEFNLNINDEAINQFSIYRPNPIFLIYNDSLYYSEFDGKCYEVNLRTKNRILVSDRYIGLRTCKEIEFLIDTRNDKVHSEIMEIKSKETLLKFQSIVTNPFFASHFFYCTYFDKYDKLICFTRDSYKQLWEFDASKIGQWANDENKILEGGVINIIGLWNELLLIHVTRNKILAINQDGTVEWEINNFLSDSEQRFFPFGSMIDIKASVDWLIDEKRGKLYFLGSRFIIEIDLLRREKKILKDCSEASRDQRWSFKQGQLEGNYIFFSGCRKSVYPDYMGIFNLDNNNIVWEFENDSNGFFVTRPYVREDKLYAKDNLGMLYVFKKDS